MDKNCITNAEQTEERIEMVCHVETQTNTDFESSYEKLKSRVEYELSNSYSKESCESEDFEDKIEEINKICRCFFKCRSCCRRFMARKAQCLIRSLFILCVFVWLAYVSYAVYLHVDKLEEMTGLLVFTCALLLIVVYKLCISQTECLPRFKQFIANHPRLVKNMRRVCAALAILTTAITFVTDIILVHPSNLMSLAGIALIVVVFFITSTRPYRVNWRLVISGCILQYLFALAILRFQVVRDIFTWIGDIIKTLLKFSEKGGSFLFGTDFTSNGFVFFLVPVVVFCLSILAVMEHLGILHILLSIVGRFLSHCTGATPEESLNAAANIFMGPIDSMMMIKPFLRDVTPSQLHCLMANSMSTVTGSIMPLYVVMGISPTYLLAASVMSAPAALALSKLAVPEADRSSVSKRNKGLRNLHASRYRSIIDAASTAAVESLTLVASIVANVTLVVSAMDMVNGVLTWLGQRVDVEGLTLQWLCSYLFYPLALSLGVDVEDGYRVAELLGIKVFINELVAYAHLGQYSRNRARLLDYSRSNLGNWTLVTEGGDIVLQHWNETLKGGVLTQRSEMLATYALCGFSNFISVGVVTGCYLIMVPHQKSAIFKYILRSMVVGHCASLMTACVAGLLSAA